MIRPRAKSALTLVEMTVVIAIAAVLAGLALPAARMMFRSFESQSGTRSMISSALASARAIAAKEQTYAGIRFQKTYHPKGPAHASQYIIFIIYDYQATGLADGFRAVPGLEPIKLPDSIGVMDMRIVERSKTKSIDWIIDRKDRIKSDRDLTDTTTFSIIFSPSGKAVVRHVYVRNRDGIVDSNGKINLHSGDDIFNKKVRVDFRETDRPQAGYAMFYQDDYFALSWSPYFPQEFGIGPESSRTAFVIYETEKFNRAFERQEAWDTYLSKLTADYINPYTGTLINKQ